MIFDSVIFFFFYALYPTIAATIAILIVPWRNKGKKVSLSRRMKVLAAFYMLVATISLTVAAIVNHKPDSYYIEHYTQAINIKLNASPVNFNHCSTGTDFHGRYNGGIILELPSREYERLNNRFPNDTFHIASNDELWGSGCQDKLLSGFNIKFEDFDQLYADSHQSTLIFFDNNRNLLYIETLD